MFSCGCVMADYTPHPPVHTTLLCCTELYLADAPPLCCWPPVSEFDSPVVNSRHAQPRLLPRILKVRTDLIFRKLVKIHICLLLYCC